MRQPLMFLPWICRSDRRSPDTGTVLATSYGTKSGRRSIRPMSFDANTGHNAEPGPNWSSP